MAKMSREEAAKRIERISRDPSFHWSDVARQALSLAVSALHDERPCDKCPAWEKAWIELSECLSGWHTWSTKTPHVTATDAFNMVIKHANYLHPRRKQPADEPTQEEIAKVNTFVGKVLNGTKPEPATWRDDWM